jgi:hypothetical protein
MSTLDPRIPDCSEEAFAIGFMAGYLGAVPETLANAYEVYEVSACPSVIPPALQPLWNLGYDVGLSFYSDHVDEGASEHD